MADGFQEVPPAPGTRKHTWNGHETVDATAPISARFPRPDKTQLVTICKWGPDRRGQWTGLEFVKDTHSHLSSIVLLHTVKLTTVNNNYLFVRRKYTQIIDLCEAFERWRNLETILHKLYWSVSRNLFKITGINCFVHLQSERQHEWVRCMVEGHEHWGNLFFHTVSFL